MPQYFDVYRVLGHMYLSKRLIKLSIDSLKNVQSTGTANGHADLFAFFLILKLQNLKVNHWSNKSEIYAAENLNKAIYLIGGMASEKEKPGLRSCLFFTSISSKKYYNPNSTFNGLASRLKDTIDNSAADHLLDKNQDDIKFKKSVLTNITKKYPAKFNLYALIYWVYRHHNFDRKYNKTELKTIFCSHFNFSSEDIEVIFDTKAFHSPEYSDKSMTYADVRNYIGLEDVQINASNLNFEISNLNLEKYAKELKMIANELKITPELISEVLDKYKQVILTGVPGVGKSYFINKLLNEYKITFIQFHQNYSYQDFVVGKTIENGSVKTLSGDLIKVIKKAQNDPNQKLLLVLDEINRGNISSIFGELMYLLDRGDNHIYLPLLEEKISLPDNLYILGTMNSADRSIAVIDYALRRRFPFITLLPNYDLIDENIILRDGNSECQNMGNFLRKINRNIKNHFNNKDLELGHSYFMKKISSLEKDGDLYVMSPKDLQFILFFEMIPMLTEYNNGDDSHLIDIFSEEVLSSTEQNLIENIKTFIE